MKNLIYDGTKPSLCDDGCGCGCPQLSVNGDGAITLADSDTLAFAGAINGDKKSMAKFIRHIQKNADAMLKSLE